MNWNKNQIEKHKKAAKLLGHIMQETFSYIAKNGEKNISENDVQAHIYKRFEKNNLKTATQKLIVAFDENSAEPHYFPKRNPKILKPETFILIDIWGRLREKHSPFADITWVAYYGKKIPKQIEKVFKIVISARNTALRLVQDKLEKNQMPTGKEMDQVTARIISEAGYKKNILHRTGHSIGFHSPHGKKENLHIKNNNRIEYNLGYTIEPGIYLPGKFGIRSEIDFYADEKDKLKVTTQIQDRVIIINPKQDL